MSPTFGAWFTGIYASEENPHRHGMYVRTIRRTGRTNRGTHYELTDGHGAFFEYPVTSVVPRSDPPVAEVIPVAVLRERRERAALSIASCERGSDVANEQDRILVAVVLAALLDEHTHTKPQTNERTT